MVETQIRDPLTKVEIRAANHRITCETIAGYHFIGVEMKADSLLCGRHLMSDETHGGNLFGNAI